MFCACDSRARDDEKNEVSSVSNNNGESEEKRPKKRELLLARAKTLRDALVYVRVYMYAYTLSFTSIAIPPPPPLSLFLSFAILSKYIYISKCIRWCFRGLFTRTRCTTVWARTNTPRERSRLNSPRYLRRCKKLIRTTKTRRLE